MPDKIYFCRVRRTTSSKNACFVFVIFPLNAYKVIFPLLSLNWAPSLILFLCVNALWREELNVDVFTEDPAQRRSGQNISKPGDQPQNIDGREADKMQLVLIALQMLKWCKGRPMMLWLVLPACRAGSRCCGCSDRCCLCSKPRLRTSSGCTNWTTAPSGGPGWTSCSDSWRSAARPSPSAPPSARTR